MAGTPFNRLLDPDRADRPFLWASLGAGVFIVLSSIGAALLSLLALFLVTGELDQSRGAVVALSANVFGAALALVVILGEAARANRALGELVE